MNKISIATSCSPDPLNRTRIVVKFVLLHHALISLWLKLVDLVLLHIVVLTIYISVKLVVSAAAYCNTYLLSLSIELAKLVLLHVVVFSVPFSRISKVSVAAYCSTYVLSLSIEFSKVTISNELVNCAVSMLHCYSCPSQ